MSSLAEKLAKAEIPKSVKTPKTPCWPVYGSCDEEDYAAVVRLKEDVKVEWKQIQQTVDDALGVDEPLELNKFIRHWRKQCSCWVVGQ